MTTLIITSDEEYICLRLKRNKERDRLMEHHCRGSVKKMDEPLEVYERLKGTDYCQRIYVEATIY